MKAIIICLVLICGSYCARSAEAIRPDPDEWCLTISTDSRKRGFQYVITIDCAGMHGAEFVLRCGALNQPTSTYEKVHVGTLNRKEIETVWNAFKSSLSAFLLKDPDIKRLDGGFVKAEMRVGSRAIELTYMNLSDTSESTKELNDVIKMIEDSVPAEKLRTPR